MRRKLAYIGIVIAVPVLILELITRTAFPRFSDDDNYMEMAFERLVNSKVIFDPNADNYSKRFGFRFSPNTERTITTKHCMFTARTNSLGFRTKEVQPREEGEIRVMLLGDSYFWGTGLEAQDVISSQMELYGNPKLETTKRSLSVYNYAVAGYNTVQQLIVARTYLGQLKPDHVVLGFFVANDVVPSALAFIDHDGNYAVRPEAANQIRTELRDRCSIFFKSTVFRMLDSRIYLPRMHYKLAARDDVISSACEVLKELDSLCREHNARFSVVIIYPRSAVKGGVIESWCKTRQVGQLIHSF